MLEKVIQKDIRDETDTPYRAAPSLLYHNHISADFIHSHADLDRAKRERDRERRSKHMKVSTVSEVGVGLGGSRHGRRGRPAERKLVKKQPGKRLRGRSRGSSRSRESKGSSAAMSSDSSPTFSFSDSDDDNNNNNTNDYSKSLWGGVVRVSQGMDEWTKDYLTTSSTLPPNDSTHSNNAVNIELTSTQRNSSSDNPTPQQSHVTIVEPHPLHEAHPIQQTLTSEETDCEENTHLLPKNIAHLCHTNKSTPLVVSNSNINKGIVSGYGSTSIICAD